MECEFGRLHTGYSSFSGSLKSAFIEKRWMEEQTWQWLCESVDCEAWRSQVARLHSNSAPNHRNCSLPDRHSSWVCPIENSCNSNECLHCAKSNRANLTGNPMANSLSMWVSSVEVSNRSPFISSWIVPPPSASNAHPTHLHKFLNAGESLGQNRYASSKHVDHLHGQIEAWSARVQRHADVCSG